MVSASSTARLKLATAPRFSVLVSRLPAGSIGCTTARVPSSEALSRTSSWAGGVVWPSTELTASATNSSPL